MAHVTFGPKNRQHKLCRAFNAYFSSSNNLHNCDVQKNHDRNPDLRSSFHKFLLYIHCVRVQYNDKNIFFLTLVPHNLSLNFFAVTVI